MFVIAVLTLKIHCSVCPDTMRNFLFVSVCERESVVTYICCLAKNVLKQTINIISFLLCFVVVVFFPCFFFVVVVVFCCFWFCFYLFPKNCSEWLLRH